MLCLSLGFVWGKRLGTSSSGERQQSTRPWLWVGKPPEASEFDIPLDEAQVARKQTVSSVRPCCRQNCCFCCVLEGKRPPKAATTVAFSHARLFMECSCLRHQMPDVKRRSNPRSFILCLLPAFCIRRCSDHNEHNFGQARFTSVMTLQVDPEKPEDDEEAANERAADQSRSAAAVASGLRTRTVSKKPTRWTRRFSQTRPGAFEAQPRPSCGSQMRTRSQKSKLHLKPMRILRRLLDSAPNGLMGSYVI